ncbi:MAG: hypothetical protein OXG24_06515 [Gammaproteobacteria bacterium]|nr:hypothetical protein [Gammaproteobacteria bacterium]
MKSQTSTKSLRAIALAGALFVLPSTLASNETSQLRLLSANSNQIEETQANTDSIRETVDGGQSLESSPGIEELSLSKLPFERNVEIADRIHTANAQLVSDWLNQSTKISWDIDHQSRLLVQRLLVEKLASTDPDQALVFAQDRLAPFRSELHKVIFKTWATVDLKAAITGANRLRSSDRLNVLNAILELSSLLTPEQKHMIEKELGLGNSGEMLELDWAGGDPLDNPRESWIKALDQAQENPSHYRFLSKLATAWIDADGIDILADIDASIRNNQIRKHVLYLSLNELVGSQPKEALDFAFKNEFPGRRRTINEMVQAWTEHDPIAALIAVHNTGRSPFRSALEDQVISTSIANEPLFLLDHLERLPVAIRRRACSFAIGRLVWIESPTKAAELVLRFDQELQLSAARGLVEEWSRKDRDAAIEWVSQHSGVEDIRGRLLHTLAFALVHDDAKLAFEIAKTQSIPEHGFGLEGLLMSEMVESNLRTALKLLPEIRPGPTKVSAYVIVALKLLERKETTKAIELGTQLTEDAALHFYTQIGRVWARIDPHGLVKSIRQFPTEGARSIVVLPLIRFNDSSKLFTDQQIKELRQYLSQEHKKLLRRMR